MKMTKERIREALKETNKWWKNQFRLDYESSHLHREIILTFLFVPNHSIFSSFS